MKRTEEFRPWKPETTFAGVLRRAIWDCESSAVLHQMHRHEHHMFNLWRRRAAAIIRWRAARYGDCAWCGEEARHPVLCEACLEKVTPCVDCGIDTMPDGSGWAQCLLCFNDGLRSGPERLGPTGRPLRSHEVET